MNPIRFALIACILFVLGGCSIFDGTGPSTTPEPKRLPDQREFGGDVLIPREMDIQKEASYVTQRGGIQVGLLRLYGRVDSKSLLRYFQNNMTAEGWRLVTRYQSPHSLLIFEKENRMAVIAVEDSTFQTFADVWVVPRNDSFDYEPKK